MTSSTPIFVYGTLRPGQINYPLIRSAVAGHVVARLDSHALRAAPTARYPYAIKDENDSITGDLLQLKPGTEAADLARLDILEGYDPRAFLLEMSHYIRVRCTVTTTDESLAGPAGASIEAWVYVAGPATLVSELPVVNDGDWTTRSRFDPRWS